MNLSFIKVVSTNYFTNKHYLEQNLISLYICISYVFYVFHEKFCYYFPFYSVCLRYRAKLYHFSYVNEIVNDFTPTSLLICGI